MTNKDKGSIDEAVNILAEILTEYIDQLVSRGADYK